MSRYFSLKRKPVPAFFEGISFEETPIWYGHVIIFTIMKSFIKARRHPYDERMTTHVWCYWMTTHNSPIGSY